MTENRRRLIVITAQNLASTNTVRPLIEDLSNEIAAVIILDNIPLSSWREFRAFMKLIRRCAGSFLLFKFAEVWVHYALSLARGESVSQLCEKHNVQTFSFASARPAAVLDLIRSYDPDYLISTGPAILGKAIINAPRIATLNCHGADLPAYRGPANYVWAMLEREPIRTVTIHRMVAAIDAGPVWRKRSWPMNFNWSVYEFNHFHSLDGGRFLRDSLRSILDNGPDPEKAQDESLARLRTFPRSSDIRRLKAGAHRMMRWRDVFRCIGNDSSPTETN